MKLELERTEFYDDRCIGELRIDGLWFCYTLEDTDRKLEEGGTKVPKETAIPRGKYKVIIDMSARFKRLMPHILDVPQFEGIRIHAGNTPVDTEGCPLVGLELDDKTHTVVMSKLAFDSFFKKLETALKDEECWLEVT